MASETISSFPRFSDLPTELRLQIWESVPQPQRIIGHVPCHCHAGGFIGPCRQRSHPLWRDRYICQPRRDAVPSMMHACRESRAALLDTGRYFQPPRLVERLELRFDVPFISYETDAFAVYEDHAADRSFDPFMALDRRRIRHVAFPEVPGLFLESLTALHLASLPQLESLSLLVCGPVPPIPSDSGEVHSWQQMQKPYLSFHDCRLLDISHAQLQHVPFFGKLRPRHPFVMLDPRAQSVADYTVLFKAWLWHAASWDPSRPPRWNENDDDDADPWWDFLEFVYDDARTACPLRDLAGCSGEGAHGKREMLDWVPPFELGCKMLCEKEWLGVLRGLGALEVKEDGDYERYWSFVKSKTVLGRMM